jgi:hypothetical protein
LSFAFIRTNGIYEVVGSLGTRPSLQFTSVETGSPPAFQLNLHTVVAFVNADLQLDNMPEKETIERARRDKRRGKAPSTQAGEFVREEIEHIREGKHGAKSTRQAIAIGLSKARRAGVKLPPRPRSTRASKRQQREPASHAALARQARTTARKRGKAARSRSAKKAARTRKRSR